MIHRVGVATFKGEIGSRAKHTPDDYGTGISEVRRPPYLDTPLEKLSVEKQCGFVAHVMYEACFRHVARQGREAVLVHGADHDEWIRTVGLPMLNELLDRWRHKYGWVPGHWNPKAAPFPFSEANLRNSRL